MSKHHAQRIFMSVAQSNCCDSVNVEPCVLGVGAPATCSPAPLMVRASTATNAARLGGASAATLGPGCSWGNATAKARISATYWQW